MGRDGIAGVVLRTKGAFDGPGIGIHTVITSQFNQILESAFEMPTVDSQ